MSWSSWSAKLNVQSIVSQGLEQVSKLKEDVEKQFDQVVTAASAQPPGSASSSSHAAVEVEPPSPAVSAALFGDATSVVPPPPPRSLDSTSRAALLSSLGLAKAPAPSVGATDAPSSAPTSRTSRGASPAVDFFGSYLPTEPTKNVAVVTTHVEDKEAVAVVEVSVVTEEKALGVSEPQVIREEAPVKDGDESERDAVTEGKDGHEDEVADCNVVGQAAEDVEMPSATAQFQDSSADDVSEPVEDKPLADEDVEGEAAAVDVTVAETTVENGHGETDPSDQTHEHSPPTELNGEHHGAQQVNDALADVSEEDIQCVDAVGVSSGEVELLKQQLAQRETQLMSTSSVIQELHDELDKTCQREVAAVEKNRFLNEQLELLRHEVLRLNRVVTQQQQASRDQELVAMQQAIAEKDEKLQALLDEGQALSVKQSQLEQRLRQLRREKNEEEEEKLQHQARSDTLAIQLQEMTTKEKAANDEKKSLQSKLNAAEQSVEVIKKALTAAQDETAQLKDRVSELETEVASVREDNASMRTELERLQHTSDSHATLSVEKTEMETTIQYLQQTVHGLEMENARREEMARMEIADLKRKWKDALQRVEMLGQSVSEATQPLLRQIQALQEDQRARQDTWKATEQTLLQRLNDANAQRKAFEATKLVQEEQLHDLKSAIDDLQHTVNRKEAEVVRERERVEATLHKEREARGKCDALQIELDELKLKLHEEQVAKQALLTRVAMTTTADANTKRADDAQVLAETTALVEEMQQLKQREEKLRHDLEWHQKELQRVKSATLSPRMAMLQHRRSFDEGGTTNGSPRAGGETSTSQASILQRTLDTSVDDSRLSSTSVLGLSQLQQRLRLRDGENRLLRQQLQALEDKQKQTTDEIVRLSTRNALLESSATQFEATQQQLEALKQKQHVLLELFGEKEEQVEELQAEVKELKAFYRKQLDTLAGQPK